MQKIKVLCRERLTGEAFASWLLSKPHNEQMGLVTGSNGTVRRISIIDQWAFEHGYSNEEALRLRLCTPWAACYHGFIEAVRRHQAGPVGVNRCICQQLFCELFAVLAAHDIYDERDEYRE